MLWLGSLLGGNNVKFENAIIYNGKLYRAGEEVPVAEKAENTTAEKTNKKKVIPKTEVN